jgi:transcriptional regulator with XRE-family HTH domain
MLNTRLKNLRLAKGLTLQQVGDVFGISRASVSSWESGTNQPDPRKLEKLALLFDTNVNFLITGEGPVSFELVGNELATKGVPFIPWDEVTLKPKTSVSSNFLPCLYTAATKDAFATRYPGSTSLNWQSGLIPAGSLLIVSRSEEVRAGAHVLAVAGEKKMEIALAYKGESKDHLWLSFVNSKLTKKIGPTTNVIGVIQEWRIGGKL